MSLGSMSHVNFKKLMYLRVMFNQFRGPLPALALEIGTHYKVWSYYNQLIACNYRVITG